MSHISQTSNIVNGYRTQWFVHNCSSTHNNHYDGNDENNNDIDDGVDGDDDEE